MVRELSFAYQEDKGPVLKEFTFEMLKGEHLAVVGHAGSGKSTLSKLLLRMYDIQKGQIEIDGTNIASADISQLRSLFSVVPQEIMLFSRSVRDNSCFGQKRTTGAEVDHDGVAWAPLNMFLREVTKVPVRLR